ncbi:uncharacterized protein LOC110990528 [Acanthaster planci]|uniref:Uncharacterized protein LOC110990528 n=1 Tax=Acanthaster planci TaxID=133434 RepID=A0A8B8A2S4_ACAPL|nr:uncharacterized protein LOC110990528 [Acanthaster planci]
MGVGAKLQICCLLWFVCAGAARVGKDGAVVNDLTVNGNQGWDGNLHALDTDCAPLPSPKSDDGQPMTLQLRDRPAAQSTQRDKQYPPVVTLVYNAGQVICSAQANPLAFSYRIILNGTIVLRTFNTSGQPLNFEPDFCTTVGCNVTNTVGTGAQRLPYPICPGSTGPDADVIVIVIGTILVFTGVVSVLLVLHCARRRTHKIEPSRNNDE